MVDFEQVIILAGNDSPNRYIFILISVPHSMTIMSLQTHIRWRKLKKICRKMFSQTNCETKFYIKSSGFGEK